MSTAAGRVDIIAVRFVAGATSASAAIDSVQNPGVNPSIRVAWIRGSALVDNAVTNRHPTRSTASIW